MCSTLRWPSCQLTRSPPRSVVRTDAGGTSCGLADACRARGVRFVTGFQMRAGLAQVIMTIPKNRWMRAISADGAEERESGEVAEITDLVDLARWPTGTRMVVRREHPHPGAQLTFTDVEGHRYQVFVTDLPEPDICFLEALHRGRGRVECAIRDAKDTGLQNLPSHSFAIDAAWLTVVLMASDLLAWMKGLCLEGELARVEPKRLRYTLLHSRCCTRSGSWCPRRGAPSFASHRTGRGPMILSSPSGGCPAGQPSPEADEQLRQRRPERPPLRRTRPEAVNRASAPPRRARRVAPHAS